MVESDLGVAASHFAVPVWQTKIVPEEVKKEEKVTGPDPRLQGLSFEFFAF